MKAVYRPWESGRFRMEPGLSPLGKDWGNGRADSLVFQLEADEETCWQNRWQAYQEDGSKYSASLLDPAEFRLVLEVCWKQLCKDFPERFSFQEESGKTLLLDQEKERSYSFFGNRAFFNEAELTNPIWLLAFPVSEDFAIMRLDEFSATGAAGVISSPNHWDPREKFGRDFAAIHAPTPHMEKIQAAHVKLMSSAFRGGAKVRFAWGVATDNRLNHHPIPPEGVPESEWAGRSLHPSDPRLWLRVERQVLMGIREPDLVLFTIRTRFVDVAELSSDSRALLVQAIEDMDAPILAYKGLSSQKQAVLDWIQKRWS